MSDKTVRGWSWKVGATMGILRRKEGLTPDCGWWDGFVVTPGGIVGVYAQDGYAHLRFVHGNREHHRTIYGPTYTERGIKTVAARFARDVRGTDAPTAAKPKSKAKKRSKS